MNLWILFYFLFLLVLGVIFAVSLKKITKEPYNPYLLRPLLIFYSVFGVIFLIGSAIFLIKL